MSVIRTVSLLLATLSMGLTAGVFGLYAHTVMPGLGQTDDLTFVGAFQAIDRAIINPWFMGSNFVGALAFTGTACATHWGRSTFAWIVAALVAYLLVIVITVTIHLPVNDAIKAAGEPAAIDVAAVRLRFREARWAAWNLVRVVASTGAVACLCWALILHGRSTA